MRKLIIGAALGATALTGCAIPKAVGPRPVAPAVKQACPAGEVKVWGNAPVQCDLRAGVNTLTILGITEAECADAGGRWYYEACIEADF